MPEVAGVGFTGGCGRRQGGWVLARYGCSSACATAACAVAPDRVAAAGRCMPSLGIKLAACRGGWPFLAQGLRPCALLPFCTARKCRPRPILSTSSFFPPAVPADVGSGTPGTDSSQFSSQHFQAWRPAFFARLAAQAARAARAIGCTCGRCGAPRVVAFSGKRQFQELFLSSGGGSGNKRSPGKGPGAGRASGGTGPRQAGEPGPPQPHNDCSSAGDRPCLDGLPAAAPTPVPGASEAAEAAGEEPQQAARGPAPAPTLQARRPGRVEVGRQWVLPEGWPLPLDTEVRCRRCSSTSGSRFSLFCVRVQSGHAFICTVL